ncbi:hypothetical protein [Aliiroseovarius sp. F20344]|uniref:hypothetical protein n=1 Tax=Aliiroseovarius sp. F20344 TaxID=2926414 RepID=UPI001FF6F715|nr:hypothetical protein [Aliiroseovarius sp. F20344]MCK0141750.1 hypothetical protein [Aliiroseovarius sp. F20344]
MRNWLVLTTAILLLVTPAAARDITIRSGEHPNFSRLVFYTAPTDTYILSRVDDGYRLTFPTDVSGFDATRVFNLIPRTRVGDLISGGEGEILILRSCDCHIKELRLPSGELVIDLVDGAGPSVETEQHSPLTNEEGFVQSAENRSLLPLFGSGHEHKSSEKQNNPKDYTPQSNPTPAGTEQSLVDKQRLLVQLSKAVAEGLIEADIDQPEPPNATSDPDPKPEDPAYQPLPHSPNDHVKMQTAHDIARSVGPGQTIATQACLPDDQFDIATWGQIAPTTTQPIGYSQGYLEEFDRPNKNLLLAHIRQTIFMTFGHEALQLIESYDGVLPDISSLSMMAQVMEFGHSENADQWLAQIGCNTRSALWAALAQKTLPEGVNTSALLRSYSELPSHLRNHLGTILARKFLDAGETNTAIEIRNIAARSGRERPLKEAQLEADIKIATGIPNEAENDLAAAVQDDLSQTQPAVTALIESKIENDRGISDQDLTLLQSIAFEHGKSPVGLELQTLHIRALFHMGRFAQGYAQFDDIRSDLKQVQLQTTLEKASSNLLHISADAEFLTFIMTRNDWDAVSDETRLKLAKRLMRLGFAEKARSFVLASPNTPTRATREFLAELALQQQKPDVALGYLAGLNTKSAIALRQQALKRRPKPNLEQQESYGPAISSAQTSDLVTASQMRDGPTGAISDKVSAILSGLNDPPQPDPQSDLQTYQAVLDSSQSTRSALNTLLDLYPSLVDGK